MRYLMRITLTVSAILCSSLAISGAVSAAVYGDEGIRFAQLICESFANSDSDGHTQEECLNRAYTAISLNESRNAVMIQACQPPSANNLNFGPGCTLECFYRGMKATNLMTSSLREEISIAMDNTSSIHELKRDSKTWAGPSDQIELNRKIVERLRDLDAIRR